MSTTALDPARLTPESLSAGLLSRLGARKDLSRGFGHSTAAPLPGAIPLLGGAPSADALPLQALHQAAADLTGDPAALVGALQYSTPAGITPLREWIARREGVDPSRVLLTNGAFHGLSLLFDALLDRGDRIVVEDPTYPLIFRDLQHHEVEVLPLPLTDQGPDLDSLEDRLRAGARPTLLYTVPDFHNPTGLVTPALQRERLVALAEHYGFVIVSDNAYAGLAAPGVQVPEDYPTSSELVVRVRTFSKVLGPGLRLGYLVLPSWLVGPVTRLRANQDQHSSVLVQEIVGRVVGAGDHAPRGGGLDVIADRARTLYARRAELLLRLLDEGVPGGVRAEHREGGIFLWARVLDPGIDLAAAQRLARERLGTDAVLGRYFFLAPSEDDRGRLRLGISHLDEDALTLAAERLIAALSAPEARR
ncbi:PLP-dependent aminotransferase family protein [Brachybacterium saurashtrense]|uniref:PLP-dependent aminotransferase family protein n=1 Tax=Brachybacterium saurashtrense TaxID=556288 RepID=A0A345YKB7_9MICO|nr:PLP-dependent aminotransferase family protein [Brachybacterium saurashtrense]AXK44369.1 PLP-dependent aminotransferase family protein [Brachybacterium saurashtrense]RRR21311.1 PLP-dependent aminotransferase family protein [Brachybacterium saurashtrense]RRR22980.1 PLP-dependent aminotransferase family protein [Brachybacterium saurashtrense]